jgi:uncharacterized membrane protein
MKIIDAFFYVTCILLQKVGRDENDAKFSAMLHTSFVSTIIILIITILVGDSFQELSNLKDIGKNYIFVIGISFLLAFFYYYRFYKTNKVHRIEEYFSSLNSSQYKTRKILYVAFNVLIFVVLVIAAKLNK